MRAVPLRSLGALGAVGAIALIAAVSCRSRSDTTPPGAAGPDAGAFDKAQLLRAFGECALSGYRDFAQRAGELQTGVARAETDPAARREAQEAWGRAMDSWERAELFQFGPAAMTGSPGAMDLRDPIYAWPLVGTCLIDQTLVAKLYEAPDFSKTSLVSTRTMASLEYLLFYEGASNSCPKEAAINAQGQWALLDAPELARRRAAYARVVTADVVAQAQRVVDAWDPAKGNFLSELAQAGSSKTFSTQQMGFNAVSDAMFYLDVQVRDMKVGVPAGIVPGCAAPPCVDAVESRWAGRSKAHIAANIAGYERLLRGCGAPSDLGFDDLLVAVGARSVATKLETTTNDAKAALGELKEPTLEDDLRKNPAGVKKLFDALRANSVVMKSDFATVLDLELPKRVEGDND